jgi:hypothetical protein
MKSLKMFHLKWQMKKLRIDFSHVEQTYRSCEAVIDEEDGVLAIDAVGVCVDNSGTTPTVALTLNNMC